MRIFDETSADHKFYHTFYFWQILQVRARIHWCLQQSFLFLNSFDLIDFLI